MSFLFFPCFLSCSMQFHAPMITKYKTHDHHDHTFAQYMPIHDHADKIKLGSRFWWVCHSTHANGVWIIVEKPELEPLKSNMPTWLCECTSLSVVPAMHLKMYKKYNAWMCTILGGLVYNVHSHSSKFKFAGLVNPWCTNRAVEPMQSRTASSYSSWTKLKTQLLPTN